MSLTSIQFERYKIQSYIKECIAQNNLERAIRALNCIVINKDFADQILILRSQNSQNKRSDLLNIEDAQAIRVANNKTAQSLTIIASELPDDFEIFKNKINYYLNTSIDIEDIIEILLQAQQSSNDKIINLKNNLSYYQKINLEEDTDNISEQSLSQYTIHINEIRLQLKDYIQSELTFDKLKPSFADDFWAKDLDNKTFHYIHIHEHQANSDSPYFIDIVLRKDNSQSNLMLWEELYLTGDYKGALKFIDELRIDKGISDQMIYEYTALAFLGTESADKIVNEAVTRKEKIKFEKLKLYILRFQSLEKKSNTQKESLLFILQKIDLAILNIYSNIPNNYLLQEKQRGYSQKREILKRLFNLQIETLETFISHNFDYSVILASFIIELDGGGKFKWLKMSKGKIINSTSFDAIKARNIFVSKYTEKYRNTIEDLAENLYRNLYIKRDSALEEFQKNNLLYACSIGYSLYKDKRFQTLQDEIYLTDTTRELRKNNRSKIAQFEEKVDDTDEFTEILNKIGQRNKDNISSNDQDTTGLEHPIISTEGKSEILTQEQLRDQITNPFQNRKQKSMIFIMICCLLILAGLLFEIFIITYCIK